MGSLMASRTVAPGAGMEYPREDVKRDEVKREKKWGGKRD